MCCSFPVAESYASTALPRLMSSWLICASTCCASARLDAIGSAKLGTAATRDATTTRKTAGTHLPHEAGLRPCEARDRGRTGRGRYVTGQGPYQGCRSSATSNRVSNCAKSAAKCVNSASRSDFLWYRLAALRAPTRIVGSVTLLCALVLLALPAT